MKGRLFLWASGGYLFGNLLVGFERADVVSMLLLGIVLAIVSIAVQTWRFGVCMMLAVGFVGLGFYVASLETQKWRALPETVSVNEAMLVVERESPKAFYQPITLQPLETSTVRSRILWRAPRTAAFAPGEYIHVACVLKRPENFDPKFDYRQYLATKGIGYVCDEAIDTLLLGERDVWRQTLFTWQMKLRGEINRLFPDPAAGLLSGLFLGGDDALSREVSDNFRRAGLSHIVAVSGYNMTLVAFTVLLLALLSGLWRKTATLLAILGIFFFLLLIDTSAASIRAAFMAWIVFFAFFLGRPANAWNGLFLAGIIMAGANPLLVRYDVGFQLSFMATLALIVASPWFERLFRREGIFSKFATLFLSTLVIELFIFPILAFHFGTITLLGSFANLLALPLIPIVMALGFVALLLGAFIPPLGPLLAFPTWLLLTLLIEIAEFFGGLTWGVLDELTPPIIWVVLWYIVLACLVWYSRKSQYRYALRMDH